MPQIDIDEHGRRIYEPDGKVLAEYLVDRSHVSVIRGPIGSGTSSCSCIKIGMIAAEQRPGLDGVRRSRWAVVRNSYPELKNTTVKTWLDWYPENLYGRFNWAKPMTHMMRWADVECEVLFLALDDPTDVAKLRSFELTGVWFNELEYIDKEIFLEAESRCGRFPAVKDGGPTWDGVIADMNAPSEDHWLPQMTREAPYPDDVPEEKRDFWPKNEDGSNKWGYFVQPPALLELLGGDNKTVVGYRENPLAENRNWLKPGYYMEKAEGKSKRWIDSRLRNKITFYASGDPVWPMFNAETHVAPRRLSPVPGVPITVSLDFGLRPSALIGQEVGHRYFFIDEFRMYGVSSPTFAPALKKHLSSRYPGYAMEFTGDPKGGDKTQAAERTSFEIFAGLGMVVRPPPGLKNNHLETRLQAFESALNRNYNGMPVVVICPEGCPTFIGALSGKYELKKVDGEAVPVKNKWSDIADCGQYWVLFKGEGDTMIGTASGRSEARSVQVSKSKSLRRVR